VETVRITSESATQSPYNVGTGFLAGNPGRPKGIVDKRAMSGRQAAQALAQQAWKVLHGLLDSEDERIKLEASKVVLEYAHGKPRQSIDIDMRGEAERIATRDGIPIAELLGEVARMASEVEN
jgi:hypothetical protein